MRAFSSREDTVVSDEPFYASYLARNGLEHPGREAILSSQSKDWMLVSLELSSGDFPMEKPVWYQKHMAQHMAPQMLGEWLSKLQHVFLIRHPALVISSYLRVFPEMTLEETGLPWQIKLLDWLKERGGVTPVVIRAEDLRRAPEASLKSLCGELGLTWDPAMLTWPAGRHPRDGVWAEHWYENTWNTTGFDADVTPEDVKAPAVDFYGEALGLYEQLETRAIQA